MTNFLQVVSFDPLLIENTTPSTVPGPQGPQGPPGPAGTGGGAVSSVAGRTGDVVLTETDVANLSTDLAGKAPIAAAWQATTAYKANQLVTNGGQLWQAKADHTSGSSFSGATNWNLIGGSSTLTINEQTGTTYTFALGDGNGSTLVELTNAAAITATIPPNSSVAFPVGTVLLIGQGGAGLVTITAGAGVTLRTPNGAKTAQQWSQATATQRAANDWIISGDTSL